MYKFIIMKWVDSLYISTDIFYRDANLNPSVSVTSRLSKLTRHIYVHMKIALFLLFLAYKPKY